MSASTHTKRWLSGVLLAYCALQLAIVPPESPAAPLEMMPISLGYTNAAISTLTVTQTSGETLPAPTITLRHTVTHLVFGHSVVSFLYDFDADVVAVSEALVFDPNPDPLIGTILRAGFPVIDLNDNALYEFACSNLAGGPCIVDFTMEFASIPSSGAIGRAQVSGDNWIPNPHNVTFTIVPVPPALLLFASAVGLMGVRVSMPRGRGNRLNRIYARVSTPHARCRPSYITAAPAELLRNRLHGGRPGGTARFWR